MTVRHLLTSTLYNTQVHQHHLPLSARVEKSKQKCHFELIVLFFWPEAQLWFNLTAVTVLLMTIAVRYFPHEWVEIKNGTRRVNTGLHIHDVAKNTTANK